MTFKIFVDILLDALKDSGLVFPFLIITYVLIELIERKASFFRNGKFLRGTHSPVLAGALGVFPQCGFSVMSAKLYENKLIKVGTLMAVFIATSDEAFAILITNGKFLPLIFLLILKFLLAVVVGYLVNAFVKSAMAIKYRKIQFTHEEYCTQCGNSKNAKNNLEAYFWFPILHALKTLAFIFFVNLIFGVIITLVGEENIMNFMAKSKFLQPLFTSLVGLIPNCASSILITQLYIKNGITFGSMFAGLCCNAGVGLAVIYKSKTNLKNAILITLALYAISVAGGIIINLFV